ncbi:heterokaryon incompatibility protein-domain-containing protein, partial [Diaporthe sp. PMI_573]
CQEWLGAEPLRHDSYLAPESLGEISRVLAECTGNCHPWKASFLPTRLIDVGASLSDIPRLVLSSDILVTTEAKYAALSYCWGNRFDAEEQLKTEKGTLKQRFKGIPFEIMTRTTRDAVELARAIGVRYVWIDALCIVQDDAADWSYESGQMHRVYQSAFVTFCGLASESCHESFLQGARTATVPFRSSLRPTINGYFSVRLDPTFGVATSRDIRVVDYTLSSWKYRAWILQEEKLSTRLLLFGASKMHFRCGLNQWSGGDGKLSRKHPASSLYATWNFLVHQYCVRMLSHETDRLPAISGLARLVGETLRDQYLAGLWRGDILEGLSWKGESGSHGLQNHLQNIQERQYIAPSWSWASFDGGNYHYPGWSPMSECTVLDVDVETDIQNPFGRVHGGYLRIRGKVAPIPSSLRKSGRRNDEWSWSATGWLLRFGGGHEHVVAWLDWIQLDEEKGLENLVMLLLHHKQPSEQPTSDHPKHTDSSNSLDETLGCVYTALMLYPTKTKDEYYRVGVVHSRGEAGTKAMRSWFEGEGNEKVCTII